MLTSEQVEKRKCFIGGSDCAGVLGLSRWETPLSIWASKTGQIPNEDKSDVLAIEVGNELEDLVCKLFSKRTEKKLARVNEAIFHPKYPFIGAHIDRRVVGEDAIFEAKTASGWKAKEWEGEDIPREYILQVMHYLAVTGQQIAYVACLIGGNQKFVWKQVVRDDEAIENLIKKEVEFWTKYVEPRVMPMQVMAADSDTLYNLFPLADTSEIALDDEANKLCESVSAMVADSKLLDDQIEKAKNELKVMLKDHMAGKTDTYKVTWKPQETTRIDTEKLKTEMPDLFQKFSKKTPSRVLRIAKLKGDK